MAALNWSKVWQLTSSCLRLFQSTIVRGKYEYLYASIYAKPRQTNHLGALNLVWKCAIRTVCIWCRLHTFHAKLSTPKQLVLLGGSTHVVKCQKKKKLIQETKKARRSAGLLLRSISHKVLDFLTPLFKSLVCPVLEYMRLRCGLFIKGKILIC